MAKAESSIKSNGKHVALYDWNPTDENGLHKSTDRIEHDIEETRSVMDSIVDVLSNRVNPRSYYDRVYDLLQKPENIEKVKEALTTAGHRVSESFQRNPLPVILLATGATWMLWETQRRRAEAQTTLEARKKEPSTFEKTKEKARETIETVKEQGTEQYGLKEKREEATSKGKRKVAELNEQFQKNLQEADQAVLERPILLGATALLAGLVAGLLLPQTRIGENSKKGDVEAQALHEEQCTKNEPSTEHTPQASSKQTPFAQPSTKVEPPKPD